MGWATPLRIERVLGEVRSRWPDIPIALHLHDTRGLAVANAHAGLKMGVTQFDATVGGLGGCPFAEQPKAAGNICTEELVLLCEEMGIDTGVDLDALIEVRPHGRGDCRPPIAGRTDPRRQSRRVSPPRRGLMPGWQPLQIRAQRTARCATFPSHARSAATEPNSVREYSGLIRFARNDAFMYQAAQSCSV